MSTNDLLEILPKKRTPKSSRSYELAFHRLLTTMADDLCPVDRQGVLRDVYEEVRRQLSDLKRAERGAP
jgi:hypothetical protein